MSTERLKISDFTKSHRAVSAKDGNLVYESIISNFEVKTPVILDFSGIELIITAFLNNCIGRLYFSYSSEQIKELLRIENLDPSEVSLLKLVIDRAKDRFEKKYPENIDEIDTLNDDPADYGL